MGKLEIIFLKKVVRLLKGVLSSADEYLDEKKATLKS